MAEAKKKPTKSKLSRASGSEKLREEAAERSETYKNTKSEHGKASTKQEPESVSGIDDSADEQADTAKSSGTAKAGKRSAKAQKEIEEKEAKASRKAQSAVAESEDGKSAKVTLKSRSKLERSGKKYRQVAAKIEKDKLYSLAEALDLATKTNPAKFDATVELHINLAVDPKQADQNVRDMVTLPAGTGKTIKVAAFVEADDAEKAKTSGADIVGVDTITAMLEKGDTSFDVLVAPPTLMASLGKHAKLLGPRGLMPNPKSGTVTTDIESAVKSAKAGRVEYRIDPSGIIHLGIGKVSFEAKRLTDNAEAVMASIRAGKPASIKGVYIKNITVTTSMGPAIRVETSR